MGGRYILFLLQQRNKLFMSRLSTMNIEKSTAFASLLLKNRERGLYLWGLTFFLLKHRERGILCKELQHREIRLDATAEHKRYVNGEMVIYVLRGPRDSYNGRRYTNVSGREYIVKMQKNLRPSQRESLKRYLRQDGKKRIRLTTNRLQLRQRLVSVSVSVSGGIPSELL